MDERGQQKSAGRSAAKLMSRAQLIYNGSDGAATTSYYNELSKRGPLGLVAINLFRASKCSARAKVYRGGVRGMGSFRSMAYERKNWSMNQLVAVLAKHASTLGITYGWKYDPAQPVHSWVLYVDLPQGQVSFHTGHRGEGPNYAGKWDGSHASADRIIAFCDQVFDSMLDCAPKTV